jgi:hypothetical protein
LRRNRRNSGRIDRPRRGRCRHIRSQGVKVLGDLAHLYLEPAQPLFHRPFASDARTGLIFEHPRGVRPLAGLSGPRSRWLPVRRRRVWHYAGRDGCRSSRVLWRCRDLNRFQLILRLYQLSVQLFHLFLKIPLLLTQAGDFVLRVLVG